MRLSINRDGWLILLARSVRALAYGFLSVRIGLYLAELGYDTVAIGVFLTVALAGSAALTILLTGIADRWGRRRVLLLSSALMLLGGVALVLSDNVIALFLAALTGTISVTSTEVGAFLSVEQAILPQTAPAAQRTLLFSLYNLAGYVAAAVGALATGLPALLAGALDPGTTQHLLFLVYGLAGAANALVVLRLSPQVEIAVAPVAGPVNPPALGLGRSRGIVLRLAGLQSVDAFAGGLVVQSLIALWFRQQYGAGDEALGALFFGASLCSAVSFLGAAWIARRIGLLNTMVFTHIPSNLFLALIPLMPTFPLAAGLLLLRQCLSQMDVPTRQAYTMALVAPEERSAAAGVTGVARSLAVAISPAVAGLITRSAVAGLPFFLSGGLKIVYDVALYFTFRHVPLPDPPDHKN
jgi:MFS family permease